MSQHQMVKDPNVPFSGCKDDAEESERQKLCGFKSEFDQGVLMEDDSEDCGFKSEFQMVKGVGGIGDSLNELENQINDMFDSGKGLQIFGYPVFAKVIQKSNVKPVFIMRLYQPFCKKHLPKKDTTMKLETVGGEQYDAKYLQKYTSLSSGWIKFAKKMELVEGDLVVFMLIEAKKFKVHIIKKGLHNITLPAIISLLQAQEKPIIKDGKEPNVYSSTKDDQRSSKPPAKETLFSNINDFQDLNNVMSELLQDDTPPEITQQCDDFMKELEKQINDRFESKEGLQIFGHPVLAKVLQKSNVVHGFLMRLSPPFCKKHLPKQDTTMKLETEFGKQYEVKYLLHVPGLSGGWKGCAIDMKLEAGDLAVFKLIEVKRFKIWPDVCERAVRMVTISCSAAIKPIMVYIIKKGSKNTTLPAILSLLQAQERPCIEDSKVPIIVYNRNKDDELSSKTSVKETLFSNIKDSQDFNNVMTEITQQCDDFNITSDLKTCNVSNFLEKFTDWVETTKLYETARMNVCFLRGSIQRLNSLAFNSSEGGSSRQRYIEACRERQRAGIEVKKLKQIVFQLKEASSMFAAEVKTLTAKPDWMKYTEAHSSFSWLEESEVEIRENEVLIDEFDKLFQRYDALIESLKLKAFDHEVEFQDKGAAW